MFSQALRCSDAQYSLRTAPRGAGIPPALRPVSLVALRSAACGERGGRLGQRLGEWKAGEHPGMRVRTIFSKLGGQHSGSQDGP